MKLTMPRVVVFLDMHTKCPEDEESIFAETSCGQQNSRHGKSHRFLLPFSSKFLDLNFVPYVLYIYLNYIKPVRNTNNETGLPVI